MAVDCALKEGICLPSILYSINISPIAPHICVDGWMPTPSAICAFR